MLASYLHKPLQYVQEHTTPTEFIMWMAHLEEEIRRKEEWKYKLECYLARLIAEVRRSWVADAKNVQDKDFFVVFKKQDEEKTMIDKEEQIAKSKKFWLTGLGLFGKKK